MIQHQTLDTQGNARYETLLKEKIQHGLIEFEREIAEPTVVSIHLQGVIPGVDAVLSVSEVSAILEPLGKLNLDYRGKYRGLVTRGTGKHHELVETWMLSDVYLAKLDEFASAVEKAIASVPSEAPMLVDDDGKDTSATSTTEDNRVRNEDSGGAGTRASMVRADDSEQLGVTKCHHAPEPTVYVTPVVKHVPYMRIFEELSDISVRALNELAKKPRTRSTLSGNGVGRSSKNARRSTPARGTCCAI